MKKRPETFQSYMPAGGVAATQDVPGQIRMFRGLYGPERDEPFNDTTTRLPPFQRESPTSRLAAIRYQDKAGTMRALVEELLFRAGPVTGGGESGGRTIEELAVESGREQTRLTGIITIVKDCSITGRIDELRHLGFVLDSGKRRKNRSGCPAAIWVHKHWELNHQSAKTPRRNQE